MGERGLTPVGEPQVFHRTFLDGTVAKVTPPKNKGESAEMRLKTGTGKYRTTIFVYISPDLADQTVLFRRGQKVSLTGDMAGQTYKTAKGGFIHRTLFFVGGRPDKTP